MKRLSVIVFLLCTSLCLSACQKKCFFVPQEGVCVNYNNVTACGLGIWMTNDALYWTESVFYCSSAFCVTVDEKEKLPSAYLGGAHSVQVLGDTAYMLDWVNDNVYLFYTCDLNTNKTTDPKRVYDVQRPFVIDECLYFTQTWSLDTESWDPDVTEYGPLCVYSIAEDETIQIAQNVFSAGVMGDTPVYLIKNENEFFLYAYNADNNKSTLIEQFTCKLTDDYQADATTVNYTSNRVVFAAYHREGLENHLLLCYDCKTDQISKYSFNDYLWSVVAYEDYAFVTITDTSDDVSSDQWNNTVSRLCLQDGTMEEVTQLQGMVSMYVASDECVYLTSTVDLEGVYRYDLDGNKTIVYAW